MHGPVDYECMNTNRLFTLAALLTSMGACRTTSMDTSAAKIVGGAPLTAENPGDRSTVAVHLSFGDCTGTLISDDLIVTAAHCLSPISPPQNIRFESVAHPTPVTRPITAFKAHPDFVDEFNFDIGWVKFSGGLPPGAAPAPILPDVSSLTEGTPLVLVGYGLTGDPGATNTAGHKLTATTTVHRVLETNLARGLLLTGPTPGKGACFGDSGGPGYVSVGGQWYVAGAVRGNAVGFEGEYNVPVSGNCNEGIATYTLLTRHRAWLAASSGETLAGPQPKEPNDWVDVSAPRGDFLEWCGEGAFAEQDWIALHKMFAVAASSDCAVVAAYFTKTGQLQLKSPVFGIGVYNTLPAINSLTVDAENFAALSPLLARAQNVNLTLPKLGGPLAGLTQARTLVIFKTPDSPANVESLTWASDLKNLQFFRLIDFDLSDLTPLSSLTGLTSLSIEKAPHLANLAPISALTKITSLTIEGTAVSDPMPLTSLTKLEDLHLAGNQIKKVAAFVAMPMTSLTLSVNPIADLKPLAAHPTLRSLYLGKPPLSQLPCPLTPPAQCFGQGQSVQAP